MSHKNFPNEKQPARSEICGPQSLANVYAHFGISCEVDKISKSVLRETHKGSMLGHLALHALQNGLTVEFYSSNPFHVSPNWKGLSSKELSMNIKEWMKNYPDDRANKKLHPICEFLDEGGTFIIKPAITSELIDSLLDKEYVIIGTIEASWLWGKRKVPGSDEYDGVRGHGEGHFIVVYDHDDENYFVSDPYPTEIEGRNGLYSIHKDTYLNSLVTYDAEFIALKK